MGMYRWFILLGFQCCGRWRRRGLGHRGDVTKGRVDFLLDLLGRPPELGQPFADIPRQFRQPLAAKEQQRDEENEQNLR
jgi:hypothetical protein